MSYDAEELRIDILELFTEASRAAKIHAEYGSLTIFRRRDERGYRRDRYAREKREIQLLRIRRKYFQPPPIRLPLPAANTPRKCSVCNSNAISHRCPGTKS